MLSNKPTRNVFHAAKLKGMVSNSKLHTNIKLFQLSLHVQVVKCFCR